MSKKPDLLNWEKLDSQHFRLKVPNGWILKVYEDVAHLINANYNNFDYSHDYRVTVCFIPDAKHEWLASQALLFEK